MFLDLAGDGVEVTRADMAGGRAPAWVGFPGSVYRCVHIGGGRLRDAGELLARRRVGGVEPFLAGGILPSVIDEELKLFYYRGLREWEKAKEYLMDTCFTEQDNYKTILNYFEIDFV